MSVQFVIEARTNSITTDWFRVSGPFDGRAGDRKQCEVAMINAQLGWRKYRIRPL